MLRAVIRGDCESGMGIHTKLIRIKENKFMI
jgi:hypothetical protein